MGCWDWEGNHQSQTHVLIQDQGPLAEVEDQNLDQVQDLIPNQEITNIVDHGPEVGQDQDQDHEKDNQGHDRDQDHDQDQYQEEGPKNQDPLQGLADLDQGHHSHIHDLDHGPIPDHIQGHDQEVEKGKTVNCVCVCLCLHVSVVCSIRVSQVKLSDILYLCS